MLSARQPPTWPTSRRTGNPPSPQTRPPLRWALGGGIPGQIQISTIALMSNARGGLYLVDFIAHNNFDNWSMDVSCYLGEPARELLKGLSTSCVIYFEDRVSDCGDTGNADQRTKKDALC